MEENQAPRMNERNGRPLEYMKTASDVPVPRMTGDFDYRLALPKGLQASYKKAYADCDVDSLEAEIALLKTVLVKYVIVHRKEIQKSDTSVCKSIREQVKIIRDLVKTKVELGIKMGRYLPAEAATKAIHGAVSKAIADEAGDPELGARIYTRVRQVWRDFLVEAFMVIKSEQ